MEFLTEIRIRRKGLGLSIPKFCRKVEVNPSVLSWVELGKVSASSKFRALVADFYGEAESKLFNENGFAK